MKPFLHKSMRILFLLAFFLFLSSPTTSFASEVVHVSDDAALFSESELNDLEESCSDISNKNEIDVIILTINETDLTRKQYIEDYYDSMDSILSDAVILLINMDSNNRGIEIQGYGDCELTVSDNRIENILDDIIPYLSDGLYYDSMCEFLDDVDYYVNLDPATTYQHTEEDNLDYNENFTEDYYDDDADYYDDEDYYATSSTNQSESSFASKSLRNLLLSIIISAIIVFFMAFCSGGRMTAGQNVYLDNSHSRILGQYDHYIRTTTTRVPKPKPKDNNSSSGFGGGGGISSGGHSHSGGGRSF